MRTLIVVFLAVAAMLLSACKNKDPLDERVKADTPIALVLWRGRVWQRLSPEQWKDFDAALQEVKYQIMAEQEATGSTDIDARMRDKIDGRTVRFVLQLGYGAKLMRLEAEEAQLLEKQQHNRSLRTRPGDEESAAALAGVVRDIDFRLQKLRREIEETRSKLAPLVSEEALRQKSPSPVPSHKKPPQI